MTNEVEVFLELWDAVRDYIPAKERDVVAETFLSTIVQFGTDHKELEIIAEEDRNLHNAYQSLWGSDTDEDDYGDDDYEELNF
jgi:hypothetical protein